MKMLKKDMKFKIIQAKRFRKNRGKNRRANVSFTHLKHYI